MHELNEALTTYIQDTENPESNFQLALIYESLGQTASACSYFLRVADRTNDKNLAYECLLKIGLCLARQGNRNNSVRGAFKHAVCLLPRRPEAYFLLARFYEKTNDHVDSYTTAELGLQFADFNQFPLRSNVEYPGRYGLIFQKSVSSWWWGKPAECRSLLQVLKNEYAHEMDGPHFQATQGNLTRLGVGPESQYFRTYWQQEHSGLRHKFNGSEHIVRSYGQVYQDLWVLSMLDGKRNGTYIEVGSAAPEVGNNTKLLEEWGWTGVGIEWSEELCKQYRTVRKNPVLQEDATKVDYDELCGQIAVDGVVDYLQLDCEPSKTTYDILLTIPFDKYKFATITYEHDHYVDMSGRYRQASRDFLRSKGYVLVAGDISPDGVSTFEDWWAHPDLIDEITLARMSVRSISVLNAVDYMFDK
jgi:tetratricopeptide (TPR) repeat protein